MDFRIPGQILWDDMLLCDDISPQGILKVQALDLEPTDVVVASYPKTGTTLLHEIVWLIRNNGDVEKANRTPNVDRVPFIELGDRDHFSLFSKLEHPRHIKTHLPYHLLPKSVREGESKVIYIIRNPKDCLVSFYHFHRMNRRLGNFTGSWDDFFEYFKCSDYKLVYGNPFDHMKEYWQHRNDANLQIVSFENIVKHPKSTIIELAHFFECELTDNVVEKIVEATRFDVMKDNPMTNKDLVHIYDNSISPFLRKGVIGDWKQYFNEEQDKIMDIMEKEKLHDVADLTFVYE